MNSNEKAVAEKLLQISAIQLRPEAPFTWASGWKSPIYCDNRKTLGFPYVRDFVKSELCSVLFEKYPEADALAGVATAGIAWGALAADQLKLPFCYVRPKPKEHGMGNQIEGHWQPGQKIVVIEDLVSTGKSSLLAVEALRQQRLEVVGMVCLFTYGFQAADEAFATAGIELTALTNYDSLIALAVEKGIVPASDQALLAQWRLSPNTWSGSPSAENS